jgi:hypothetical protein
MWPRRAGEVRLLFALERNPIGFEAGGLLQAIERERMEGLEPAAGPRAQWNYGDLSAISTFRERYHAQKRPKTALRLTSQGSTCNLLRHKNGIQNGVTGCRVWFLVQYSVSTAEAATRVVVKFVPLVQICPSAALCIADQDIRYTRFSDYARCKEFDFLSVCKIADVCL